MKRIEKLAYQVELPNTLVEVHNVFYGFHLRRYVCDPKITIEPTILEDLVVESDITLIRRHIRIVDRDTKELMNKTVLLIKSLMERYPCIKFD